MTDLVERVARAIETEFTSPGARPHGWTDEARAAIRVVVEECARKAESIFPRGSAHTYASENADVYIAQEDAGERISAAIRALANETKGE